MPPQAAETAPEPSHSWLAALRARLGLPGAPTLRAMLRGRAQGRCRRRPRFLRRGAGDAAAHPPLRRAPRRRRDGAARRHHRRRRERDGVGAAENVRRRRRLAPAAVSRDARRPARHGPRQGRDALVDRRSPGPAGERGPRAVGPAPRSAARPAGALHQRSLRPPCRSSGAPTCRSPSPPPGCAGR